MFMKKAKHLYLTLSQKIKNFLLNAKSREFLIFLFFLIIAGGFWLLQTLDNEYEADLTIPVKLRGVPENVVITTDPAQEVHVKVKDRGTALLNYKLRSRFLPLVIEFEDYQKYGPNVKIHTSDFDRKIQSQLSTSTRLISIVPDTLDYVYTNGISKKVPVKINGQVSPGRQYYLSSTLITPDSILVYAPQAILDTLSAVYTEPIEASNITDTLRKTLKLAKISGTKIEPQVVDAIFAVDMFTEKRVEVPLVGVNFPSDKVLRTFPSKVQITFQLGMGNFRDVTADDFLISVSYDELMNAQSDTYKVKLKAAPDGVNVIRIYPENVDFLIEQISSNEH